MAVSFGVLLLWISVTTALHLEGVWKPSDRYLFLTKFGFQRTQIDELDSSRGYVYGRIQLAKDPASVASNVPANLSSLQDPIKSGLSTLVLVHSELILGLYANATQPIWLKNDSGIVDQGIQWLVENERCRRMFAQIDAIAWHRSCAPKGQLDLLRSVPCPSKGLCAEEDTPNHVIKPFQFTYAIQDLRQPRYWYLSLVACRRNPITCRWETTAIPRPDSKNETDWSATSMAYSIWLVNGAPHLQRFNTFEHQFSFETHDTAEMYLIFFILYLILAVIVHIKLPFCCKPHSCLYLISVWLATLGLLLTTIHSAVFAFDGRGLRMISWFGVLILQWADAIFLALLISTAHVGLITDFHEEAGERSCRRIPSSFSAPSLVRHEGAVRMMHKGNEYERLSYANHLNTSDSDSQLPFNSPTTRNKTWSFISCLAILFVSVTSAFYIWAQLDEDPVIDFSIWNTVPGCMLLAFRFNVAFWFLAILRCRRQAVSKSSISEGSAMGSLLLGLDIDLAHFAAGFLLWMFVLPLVVFIAEVSMSSLWRYKTIISVSFSANYLATSMYGYLLYRCGPQLKEFY